MTKETLDRFAETLHSRFHRVKWESADDEFGSETNRESWRSCAQAVIEEYQKWIEENIVKAMNF
jgi:hypothetical protein